MATTNGSTGRRAHGARKGSSRPSQRREERAPARTARGLVPVAILGASIAFLVALWAAGYRAVVLEHGLTAVAFVTLGVVLRLVFGPKSVSP